MHRLLNPRPTPEEVERCNKCFEMLRRDYEELKEVYPYAEMKKSQLFPFTLATIHVVAVDRALLEKVMGEECDYTGTYSKELYIKVPLGYTDEGCEVYGGGWIDLGRVKRCDWHFHDEARATSRGFHLCVGTKESFSHMKNVVLESVRTADYMLTAYERIMRGETERFEAKAYSHGDKGLVEYRRDKGRFKTSSERGLR